MSEPTQKQFDALPKWAQGLIGDLTRQREEAVRALDKFEEGHKEGKVVVTDFSCHTTPPTILKTCFDSDSVEFHSCGLEVHLLEVGDGEGVRIRWSNARRWGSNDVTVHFDSPGGIFLPKSPEKTA